MQAECANRPLCLALETPVGDAVSKDTVENLIARGRMHAVIAGAGSIGMCNTCTNFVKVESNGLFPGVAGCQEGLAPPTSPPNPTNP